MDHKNKPYLKLGFFLCVILLAAAIILPQGESTLGFLGLMAALFFLLFERSIKRFTPIPGEDLPKQAQTLQLTNRFVTGILLSVLTAMAWMPALGNTFPKMRNFLPVLVAAILMVIIGLPAKNIPFNQGIGLRLPWTIRDEKTWRVAHEILSKNTLNIVGILLFGTVFFGATQILIYGLLVWIAIPTLVSRKFYKLRFPTKESEPPIGGFPKEDIPVGNGDLVQALPVADIVVAENQSLPDSELE